MAQNNSPCVPPLTRNSLPRISTSPRKEQEEVISGVNTSLILFAKMAVFADAVSRGLAAGVVIWAVS
jgi:hypothetical protein